MSSLVLAQCVMCYRTAAAQQVERSRVLNSGIIILLVPPLCVLGLILFMAYRKRGTVGRKPRVSLLETKHARDLERHPVQP